MYPTSHPPADSDPAVPFRWLIVAGLLAGASAICALLDPLVSLTSLSLIYVLAVVVAAYRLDRLASAVCAVGAVVALNFFFVSPRWTLLVDSREQLIALAAMLVVALVISHLAARLRSETRLAHISEQRARQLQLLASELADAHTPEKVLALGNSALGAAFAGPCMLVSASQLEDPIGTGGLEDAVRDGLRSCMAEAAVLGPGTGRWPGLSAWYLPVGTSSAPLGAARVVPALAGDESGREHAQALCALLAQALLRMQLGASMLAAQDEARHQQLQSTFLAAISHDLRTPLAAIVGAASSLATQRAKLPPAEQDRLLGSIASEAGYLSEVTENTLQLVRLSGPAQALRRDWESLEEIVGSVLARVRQRDPARRITSTVPAGLPLVQADPVLIAQLIGNLLDNALAHTEGPIDLVVAMQQRELVVSVRDQGPRVSDAEQARIFEPHVRGDRAGPRGAGLGLAVCSAIATAHGGRLVLLRRGSGNDFSFTLPADAPPLAEAAP